MDHVYKAIARKLLSEDAEITPLLETRIQSLYGHALEAGYKQYPLDFGLLCDEIIRIERSIMILTISHLSDFEKVKPLDIIQYYSLISFELAKNRFDTQKSFLLGALLREALNDLLDADGVVSAETKRIHKLEISETLMDFIYASGASENTSLRMAPLIQQRHYQMAAEAENKN